MPSFEEGWIDNYVKLVPLHRGAASRTADETPPVISEDQATVSAAAGLTLRVSGLESASRGVVSVSRDDSLARAQSLMLHGDFSQLPVLAGTRELQGAVSWESIAQARMHRKDACMRDCIVPADVVGINDDLLAHIRVSCHSRGWGWRAVDAVESWSWRCRPAPARCLGVSPGAGVKAGRRPPEGLGLDAGEDEASLGVRGWVVQATRPGRVGHRPPRVSMARAMRDWGVWKP